VHAAGVSTVLPIPSRNGELVEAVPNRDHEMLAVIFEAAPGEALQPSGMTEEHVAAWGRLLANLHNAAPHSNLENGTYRRDWRAEFDRVVNWLPVAETSIHGYLRSFGRWLESLPQTPHVFGLVHFDVQGDNLLWAGETATVIDFDDCLFYWFAGDIARALATFEHEDANRRRQLTRWLLDGYRQVRAFDALTSRWLPQFAALTNIGSLAWHLHSATLVGSAPDSHQIEQKLRDRIAATMSGSD
jgi:Ser/Thr protein kinase RdoA (MazF antagonist)